jgi:hypothetical protein
MQAWIRVGDPLLIATAELLGALREAAEFPQDEAGIKALIAAGPRGPEGEKVPALYEPADAPITYLGRGGTRVAPAGEGRIRLRRQTFEREDLVTHTWILGPDGSLGDPVTTEGYGVPEDELPAAARAELDQIERRRQEAEARRPEEERRSREHRYRHRLEHLLGVVPGPIGQDPSGAVVTHVVLYDTNTLVHYLVPPPAEEELDPDDPWADEKAAPQTFSLDDGLGTEFASRFGEVDRFGKGPLRCKREFSPAVSPEASRLVIGLDETRITVDLRIR